MKMTTEISSCMKKGQLQLCAACKSDNMRSRIVLYQDKDSESITKEKTLWESVQQDLKVALLVH